LFSNGFIFTISSLSIRHIFETVETRVVLSTAKMAEEYFKQILGYGMMFRWFYLLYMYSIANYTHKTLKANKTTSNSMMNQSNIV